jgi:hypothetical protein
MIGSRHRAREATHGRRSVRRLGLRSVRCAGAPAHRTVQQERSKFVVDRQKWTSPDQDPSSEVLPSSNLSDQAATARISESR